MTKTLNHYNKRHKRRRNKTQRKDKKRHGGRRTYYDFRPGQVHYFDQTNLDMLDALMERERRKQNPLVIRHYRKTCPHCEDFEKPWSELELNLQDNPLYSAASLNEDATKHITKEYPDYPRVNGVPTVVVVDSNGVPIEHTGPNTLDAIEKFLNEHGLQIKIVPIEEEPKPEEEPDEEPEEEYAGANDDTMNDSADGLGAVGAVGAGLGAGLGVVAAEPENPSMLSNVKQTVTKIDDSIKGGLEKVSDTFTKSIDFNNLFASSDDTTIAPASAPASEPAPASAPAPAPAPASESAPASAAAADAFPPAPPADVNALALAPPPLAPIADDANALAAAAAKKNNNAVPQMPSGGKRGKKTRRRRGNNNHNNHNNHNKSKSKRRHTKRSKRHTK